MTGEQAEQDVNDAITHGDYDDQISEPLADGIYFHMPEAQYHALDRLSTSGVKDLIVSTLQFSTTHYDEDYIRPNTLALHKGKAYHKRILEGKGAFNSNYVKRLEKSDIDGCLDTQAELKDFCNKNGLAVSGTKPVLTERILDVQPEMKDKILALAQDVFNKEHAHQIQLTSDELYEIKKAAAILEASDLGMHFTGGFPEVSILWTDEVTGIKCKARIDYLRHDILVDLKTFSNSQRKPIPICISQAIAYEKYNIQACFYMNGFKAIKKMLVENSAASDVDIHDEYDQFFKSIINNEQEFVFVFQESGQVNNCAARKFVKKTSGQNNNYWYGTQDIIFDMMHKYDSFMKSHGKTKAWLEHQETVILDDADLPIWMTEYN